MNTRSEWLKQIATNPQDWQTVLIFADWLEEQGEELEAEQWRFAVQWTSGGGMDVWAVIIDGRFLHRTLTTDRRDWRQLEFEWCEQNNVRFIPMFPRTISDLEAIRSGAIDNAETTR